MLRILWNSKSAMVANSEKLDAISNNISNVNTDGYKREEVSFKDLVNESLVKKGYPTSNNVGSNNMPFTGTGVRASSWVADNKQGSLSQTYKSTDLAIDGEGYFKVTKADGESAYTRVGTFSIDSNGNLSDSNGNRLNIDFANGYNENNVKFTSDNFSVNESGDINLKQNGVTTKVGNIPLYNSYGDKSMIPDGESLNIASKDAQVYKVNNASIRQGFTEGSNVDLSTEMTDMLVTQRAFELNSKGITTADQMWQIANNLTK
jgi:flagellar basal-body rod protein FlgG